VSVLLTGKLRVLWRRSFWIAPAVVALLCLPWQIWTLQMAERGWTGGTEPSLQYTISALGQFAVIIVQLAGLALGILALLGIAVTVVAPTLRRQIETAPAVMFAFIVCTWIFHAIVPAGVETRKMVIAVPAWVLFIFGGGLWLAGRLPLGYRLANWRPRIVALAGAVVFGLTVFSIPHQPHYGYADAAEFITSQPDLRRQTILVSDNSIGEGLLISEVAMHEQRPGNLIVRGTKALADVDWSGAKYHSVYSTPEQVSQAIDRLHVNLVVVDTFPGGRDLEHNALLRQALKAGDHFQLIRTFDGHSWDGDGKVLIYRVRHSA
jgi:hypothetical protein